MKVAGDYSAIGVFVPAPPKMVTKYAVTGNLFGVSDFSEIFDDESTAHQTLAKMTQDSNYSDKLGLKVEAVELAEGAV